MFGIKTRIKKKLKHSSKKLVENRLLQTHGMSWFQLFKTLAGTRLNLQEESTAYKVSSPITPLLNPVSRFVKIALSRFNPNNLGNWQNSRPYNLPTTAESSAVEIYKNLLQAPNDVTGYFTSGATEGNIFCVWAGKSYLKKLGIPMEKIILIRTDLTHYSVEKAAKITEVEEIITPISLESWTLDSKGLLKTLQTLYVKGKRGFLLTLTQGYTIGGTDDPVETINQILTRFQKAHPKAHFFVWIDAAYAGVSKPFLEKNWRPFSHAHIQAVVADFHKTLGVSYPAGIILHKKSLSKLIETTPSYIDHPDQTLLGSRSGSASMEVLFTLQFYGFKRLKNIFRAALNTKEKAIADLKSANIVTHSRSLQAAIISLKPLKQRSQKQKILTTRGVKTIYYSKLYFFPKF